MLQKDILSWYEAGLPAQERKTRGHFSTPSQLVEQILDACGYTADKDLARLRVLDPACGSGNFLAGAAHRLLSSGRRMQLTHKEQIASVQRNIWGFDPDPVACFLAEMQLRAVLTQGSSAAYADQQKCEHHNYTRAVALHIQQADGLAFPWEQQQNIDLFLANPPYLAAKNTDLSGYQIARQRGQADSYLLFLNLALQIVRPGGWIGLVIPDPVLARANAIPERQRLLTETTVHHLWHLSGVFSAYVGAVVIIAQKIPPRPMHAIAWQRSAWSQLHSKTVKQVFDSHIQEVNNTSTSMPVISQPLLRNQPGAELRYLLSNVQNSLIGRLHAHRSQMYEEQERLFTSLGELVSIRRGEESGKESKLLHRVKPEDGQDWYPVLRGGSGIRPYTTPVGDCWIAGGKIVKPIERYRTPKLLVVKSTGLLQAALDLRGHIVLQTLYLLYLRTGHSAIKHVTDTSQNDELHFLLALLNSRLLQEYVYVLYTAYKWVQPQIEQHVLAYLPVPTLEGSEKAQISQRAQALMRIRTEGMPVVEAIGLYKELYEEQERAICALYEKVLDSR